MAVDTLGRLLVLHVTVANQDDRADMGRLGAATHIATDQSVELVYVDQGYTGERLSTVAQYQGIVLESIKVLVAKRGFVLLPRR